MEIFKIRKKENLMLLTQINALLDEQKNNSVKLFDDRISALENSLQNEISLLKEKINYVNKENFSLLENNINHISSMIESYKNGTTSYLENNINHIFNMVENNKKETISYLEKIVIAFRTEVLLEMRALLGRKENSQDNITEVKILNKSKYEKFFQDDNVFLNIGAGTIQLENYLNVDLRELPGIDIIADALNLGVSCGSISEIRSSHLLEHFPIETLRRRVFPYWRDLLREEGVIRCIIPDAVAMIKDFMAGSMSFDDFRTVTFGLQDYEGDFHYTMFSYETMEQLLTEAGFTELNWIAQGRKNGMCLEMEITAKKRGSRQ